MSILNKPLTHILLITFAVFLAYSNTFHVPFHFDDIDNIVKNPVIKDLRYVTDPSWIDSKDNTDHFDLPKWGKPLFKRRFIGYLTFAMNYAIDGLNVRGYHLVNILIHAANAVLLYWIIILTFRTPHFPSGTSQGSSPSAGSRDLIALFTALFFAVHPIQTQAVTYIVQRFASLATLFFLLALLMYIQFRLSGLESGAASRPFSSRAALKRYAAYSVSFASVVLAIKTKEFGMLLPAVITLYEFMFFEGSVKKRLQYLVPFGLTIAILPLTLLSMSGSLPGAGGIDNIAAIQSGAQEGAFSRTDYLFTQFRVIVTYIRLLFLPIDQSLDYDYPIYHSFFEPQVALSFLFLLSIFAGGLYLYHRSRVEETSYRHLYRLGSFGIFWFFLTLSGESSIIPIADVIFEHRVYLPSIGFFITLSSIVALVSTRWEDRTGTMKKFLAAVLTLLVVALSAATFARNVVWQSRTSLSEDDVWKNPGKARPHTDLGYIYAEQGRMSEALHHMKIAIALNFYYPEAHYNLGHTYAAMGQMEQAIYEYKLAAIEHDYVDAHSHLGLAYAKLGRTEEAIKEYRIALELAPYSVETHYSLGDAYAALGRREEAVAEYRTALRLKPDFLEARQKIESNSPKK